jgi:hypothetical protein
VCKDAPPSGKFSKALEKKKGGKGPGLCSMLDMAFRECFFYEVG